MGANRMSRLFTELSKSILDAEEKVLTTGEFADITINDIHVIDAVGNEEARPSSVVAKRLGVTMGTLTKAVDGLVKKQYVQRTRSENDKRLVLLSLLPKGLKVFKMHAEFHDRMMDAVLAQFAPEETLILERGLDSLKKYLVNGLA